MTRRLSIVFAALLALVAGTAAHASAGPGSTVVVLPFDNVSGAQAAPDVVQHAVELAIANKGWTVVEHSKFDAILEEERVRYLDSLAPAARQHVLEATGAGAVVTGSIHSYADGGNAVVALSARMVRIDGSVAWAEIAGLSASDTEGAFGFGRKRTAAEVADAAVAQLTRTLPAPGAESPLPRGRSAGFFNSGATSFRADDLDPSTPHRVCVLPFENMSPHGEAPRTVADILAVRLAAANGFEVVDPAMLRQAALDAHIGSFRNISDEALASLASAVGTPLFIRGTVYEYRDSGGRPGDAPEVQIELTLVDLDKHRVLWAAQNDRAGQDYSGFLLLGEVTNAVALTDRAITEMIEAGGRGAPRAARAFAAARAARRKGPEVRSELVAPGKGDKKP